MSGLHRREKLIRQFLFPVPTESPIVSSSDMLHYYHHPSRTFDYIWPNPSRCFLHIPSKKFFNRTQIVGEEKETLEVVMFGEYKFLSILFSNCFKPSFIKKKLCIDKNLEIRKYALFGITNNHSYFKKYFNKRNINKLNCYIWNIAA